MPNCQVPLWPFIFCHLFLSVWGYQALWVSASYAWMNFAIVAIGCWVIGQKSIKENCLMLIISLILGFIMDIVFIGIYGDRGFYCPGTGKCHVRGEYIWSFIAAIINCLLKIATLIFAVQEYKSRGGSISVKASVQVNA